jgi:CheY-like chemotaxis protein
MVIVDDHDLVRTTLVKFLSQPGAGVRACANAGRLTKREYPAGFDALLLKPFTADDLLQVIDNVIRSGR